METSVLLRDTREEVKVSITHEFKPDIKDNIKQRWQPLITLVADILDVPAGLIMQITETHMEVFLKSENEDNPYPKDGKDRLLHGLYCETVIGQDKPLHIENSLNLEAWKDNPDVELGMISYYGLPIKWGDGTFFGTICVLDNESNEFKGKYRKLMTQFKDIIEQDLLRLEEEHHLLIHSNYDFLTGVFNRRKFSIELVSYNKKYIEENKKFSLTIIDIDAFKYINDFYGHVEGDRVLKTFAQVINENISDDDVFCRYGGDEFALISNINHPLDIENEMKRLLKSLMNNDYLSKFNVSFSYGSMIMSKDIDSLDHLIRQADRNLYIYKEQKKSH